jgi:hypothetical protein
MPMTDLDDLWVTLDDCLEVARKLDNAKSSRELSMTITKLEEAQMWAARIEAAALPQESRATPGNGAH